MANEMLFVFSHCASWSPTFTSSERVLRDAMVNSNRIVMTKLLMIIFKNLNILNFGPEPVIVVYCKSGTQSLYVQTDSVRWCWMTATCWTESKHLPTLSRKWCFHSASYDKLDSIMQESTNITCEICWLGSYLLTFYLVYSFPHKAWSKTSFIEIWFKSLKTNNT